MPIREIWNDSVGVVLCLSGLVGIYFKVECSGWLIFFGALFFCATPNEKESAE